MTLGFLTLYAADLEKTLRFYRLLGLDFRAEQHGTGPLHYATTSGPPVIEIYPGGNPGAQAVMIGLETANLTHCRATATKHALPLIKDITPNTPARLILRDPDGRQVFVAEAPEDSNP